MIETHEEQINFELISDIYSPENSELTLNDGEKVKMHIQGRRFVISVPVGLGVLEEHLIIPEGQTVEEAIRNLSETYSYSTLRNICAEV